MLCTPSVRLGATATVALLEKPVKEKSKWRYKQGNSSKFPDTTVISVPPPYKGTNLLQCYCSDFPDSSSRLTCMCEIPSSQPISLKLMPWAFSSVARWQLCCLLSLHYARYSSRGATPSERLCFSLRSLSRCFLVFLKLWSSGAALRRALS